MFAVIEANGRQLRVQEGDVVRLDGTPTDGQQRIVFDRVLFAFNGKDFLTGSPLVADASVTATILRSAQAPKIKVFHYKPKKRIRKRYGHRQPIVELRIEKIALP